MINPQKHTKAKPAGRLDFFRALFLFGLANCPLFYLNAAAYLPARPGGLLESAYLYAAFLSHFLLLALLLAGVSCLVYLIARLRAPAAVSAVLLFSLAQAYVFVDVRVWSHFRFHVDGEVLRSMLNPGYWDSMHFSARDTIFTVAAVLALTAFQAVGLRLLYRAAERRKFPWRLSRRPAVLAVLGLAVLLALGEKITYGVADLYGMEEIAAHSRILPFYQPIVFSRGRREIFDPPAEAARKLDRLRESRRLDLPRPGYRRRELPRPHNVVVLLMEGVRADMFAPETMPNLVRFGRGAITGQNHYSAGNTTRNGVFGLFYSLPGNYWQLHLGSERRPLLFDRLLENDYEFKVMSSTRLTYPEFDRTLFAELPYEIEDRFPGDDAAERDANQVDEFVGWLSTRADERPFFAFLFLDSPHAFYFFPEEFARFTPYADSVSFISTNLRRERDGIFNRYRNSVFWLDHLLGEALKALEENGRMEDTVILVTSDHGEEFWETGYYGHNSAYTDYQVRVPFVLHIPGRHPREIEEKTSHFDFVPTLLRALGDENPVELYSVGNDLAAAPGSDFLVLSGWSDYGLVTPRIKARFRPGRRLRFCRGVTDLEDRPVEDGELVREELSRYLLPALELMTRFLD